MKQSDANRLEAFENMLKSVVERYNETVRKMEKLKAQGKTKSATYRQLMGEKLTFQRFLSMYQAYGLTDTSELED